MIRFLRNWGLGLVALSGSVQAAPGGLPSDVEPNSWAANAVRQTLENGVLKLSDGQHFRGESKVTRAEGALALAAFAKKLEAGTWRRPAGHAVPDRILQTTQNGGWERQPLTRYTFAYVLAKAGDYVANGVPRPPAGSKTLGKSESLPPAPTISLPKSNSAYAALAYLVRKRMIGPGSVLLKADSSPLTGQELSRALGELLTGLNDCLTELGLDAEGATPDASFHAKRPPPK